MFPLSGPGVASLPRNVVRWFLFPGFLPCGARTGGEAPSIFGWAGAACSGARKLIECPTCVSGLLVDLLIYQNHLVLHISSIAIGFDGFCFGVW